MVNILSKTNKVKFHKNVNFYNENFEIEAQATVVPCHPDDSIINNIPYTIEIQKEDYLKINGENMYYSKKEIQELISSKDFKNFLLKEIATRIFS